MRGGSIADEELRAVGVGASVRHRQDTGMCVREPDLLIVELLSINADTAGTVACSSVTTLHHEVGDDAMEFVVLVVKGCAAVAYTKLAEVLSSLRHIFTEDLKHDTALLETFLALRANSDIEERLHIGGLEGWEAVEVLIDGRSWLVVVHALFEEGCHATLLCLHLIRLLLLNDGAVGAEACVRRVQLDRSNDISHSFDRVIGFAISD